MQLPNVCGDRDAWSRRWLVFLVHLESFRTEPTAYLTAFWWRLRGKKLRSRYQFASLLGRTKRSYSLWLMRASAVSTECDTAPAHLSILALVDGGMEPALADTQACLEREGIKALIIGTSACPTLADAVRQIEWQDGLWFMPLRAGDRLARGASMAYLNAVAGAPADTQLVYADDDLLQPTGRTDAPHFKPGWNPELFRHHDYLSGACILRAATEDFSCVATAQDWVAALTARVAGRAAPIHLPKIIHHRRQRHEPVVPAMPTVDEQTLPSVSVIVPTRNRLDLLRTCLHGVASTIYPGVEVIIVDNDSDDRETLDYLDRLDQGKFRVLRHHGAFNFSAINNRAAQVATGSLLCLLNNDIEVTSPDWLKVMAVHAQRPDVGAVGACLLYPDGQIQHAGVVIGMGNAAGHAHRFLQPDDTGYFRRHMLPQFVTAVTAACLVVERAKFLAVGGLNETDFPVAFNDVDLCLRLDRRGWHSFYEPRATLVHHESVSRGFDRDPAGAARFSRELAALQRHWHTDEVTDRFHHPQLSRASEQFLISLQ